MLKYCLNADSKIVFGHNNLKLKNIIICTFEARAIASREKQKGEKDGKAKVNANANAEAEVAEDLRLNIQFEN